MSYKVCLALSLTLLKVLQNGCAEWTQPWTTLFCIKSLLIPVAEVYEYNSPVPVPVQNVKRLAGFHHDAANTALTGLVKMLLQLTGQQMILMMPKPGDTHQPSYTFEIVVDIDPSTILQKKPSQDHVRLVS